jgi:hypothetical protein
MKKSVLLSVMLALPFAGLAVSAQAGNAVADVDVHVSTLGVGLGVAFPVSNSVDARIGFNQFSKSFSTTTTNTTAAGTTNINYIGNLKLSTIDLLADWHPFNGMTHLTAGLMYNNNKFEATGVDQTTGASVNATVNFNKMAPYLGFGWSGQAKNTGWSFKSDFGVLFQGAPTATLTTNNAVLAATLASEQATLNDKLKNFKYYPVVSIGIGYAF